MAKTSSRSKRKVTGGRYNTVIKKRLSRLSNDPTLTKLDSPKIKIRRARGGHKKLVLLSSDIANVYDPKSKKYQKTKIKTILESSSNRYFVRRNIMTKGTIISTELGKAKVTSRPGQHGIINAILLKEQ